MSIEIPPEIQMEIDATYEPNQTGQIRLNVFQGKIVSADLKRHVKASPEGVRENSQGSQQKILDFQQATP